MSKYFLILLILSVSLFSLPTPALAHLSGQPPYLRINGQYTNLYPVPISSAPTFNLPQDIASGNFLIGKKVDFAMEVGKLPAPPEIVQKTKFTWDWGDGSAKDLGLSASHTYNKMGSYVQIIYADDGSTPEPQLLSSVLINILPDPNYKLPKPQIFVNNISPQDPLTDPLKFDLTQNLNFDGSKSQDGTGKIMAYTWDLGDGTTQEKQNFTFQYTSQVNQVFPVLRVRDDNGFIADTYVELETGNSTENNAIIKAADKKLNNPNFLTSASNIFFIVGGIGLILVVILLIIKKRKKYGRNNNS